jgi:tetratricopeptide (TPR) repeat protein
LDEALPSLHAADVVRLLASHVECRGFLCKASGDLAGARRFYEQSLPMYQLAGAAREALRLRDALADTVWAQGDLDAARSGFESALLGMRESPLFDPIALGICLCNLAGVHVERGEVSPALELAREGLPLMQQVGFAFAALDHLAVRAATCGRLADAALIAGQVDAIYERRDARREANEARARARLQRLLSAGLSAGELGPLIETGARLSEEEACRLALLA